MSQVETLFLTVKEQGGRRIDALREKKNLTIKKEVRKRSEKDGTTL